VVVRVILLKILSALPRPAGEEGKSAEAISVTLLKEPLRLAGKGGKSAGEVKADESCTEAVLQPASVQLCLKSVPALLFSGATGVRDPTRFMLLQYLACLYSLYGTNNISYFSKLPF